MNGGLRRGPLLSRQRATAQTHYSPICTAVGLAAEVSSRFWVKHVRVASERYSPLASKRVSPHVLRPSSAMQLLEAGVDCSVTALWLGHESIETTQTYVHAHLALKDAALPKAQAVRAPQANPLPTK